MEHWASYVFSEFKLKIGLLQLGGDERHPNFNHWIYLLIPANQQLRNPLNIIQSKNYDPD